MTCIVCGKDLKIMAKGMCSKCYLKQHVPKVKKPKPIKIKKIKPVYCEVCGREKPLINGKCQSCYSAYMRKKHNWQPPVGICKVCGKEKKLPSYGTCMGCITAERRRRGLVKKVVKLCKVCGQPAMKRLLCEEHYNEYKEQLLIKRKDDIKQYYERNRERILEVSKEHHRKNGDIYRQRAREWQANHYDKFRETQRKYMAKRSRQYTEEQKRKISEQKKEYYRRKKNEDI